ncbi:MAG: shikimate dehydrogenase, partial [Muribaculaceae bacterium]|nr:shikimate dehydrogenase [Muribaculaceae bacterium]
DAHYYLFPLPEITDFPHLIADHPDLVGLNVTIPYKVDVIPYLDGLSEEAEGIGAVNVIKIDRSKGEPILIGHNSDAYGFTESLKDVMTSGGRTLPAEGESCPALVLGTGGASKAVVWSLRRLGFSPQYVGRKHREDCLSYDELTREIVERAGVIVNATPLGMTPDVDSAPPFPYGYLDGSQTCFDLVYNPEDTLFMQLCRKQGCLVSNGLEMLRLQAEGAWKIWNG